METFIGFTIVGITTAAIYAVVGSGLVLTYTTTGIFNFAHGAIGMIAAFAYWQLHVGWGWPLLVSVAVVVGVVAPVVGLGLEWLMRGLDAASETTRLVVSISLMLGIIGLVQAVWNPNVGRTVSRFFPADTLDLGVTTVSYHQLVIIAVAVGVAVGLRFLLYRTRTGVAMRAVVDNRSLSQLTGARIVRVQQLSWIAGTVLAAVGGVLVASTAGLNAIVLSLLIVNAYAAAIFGRLRSLPLTFVGALVIGLTDGYLQGYLPQNPYLAGLRLASPVIILFIVLLVLPNPRLRGNSTPREHFPAPSREGALTFCAVLLLAGVVLATTLSLPDVLTYAKLFPFAIIALSLVPLLGFGNQVSLCQLSLAGVGAIAYGHLGGDGSVLGLVGAVALTAAVGALIALPALRLSGIYMALATAAFAVALDRWIFFLPDFDLGPITVSVFGQGTLNLVPPDLPGVDLTDPRQLLVATAAALALLTGLVAWIRRNAFGRLLLAQRDNEAACATLGMSLVGTRLAVFSLSAGIAGLGGALYGMQLRTIEAQSFSFTSGLPVFMLVAVAGAGFLSSALFTGTVLQAFFPLSSVFAPWFTKWQSLTSATTGLSLGRDPEGVVARWRKVTRPLIDDLPVRRALLVALVAAWIGRLADLYGGWAFVALLVLVPLAGLAAAVVRDRRAGAPSGAGAGANGAGANGPGGDGEAAVPLELAGLTSAWQPAQLAEIGHALDLGEFPRGAER
jgi:branched-chain amino acid transport system permease protein